MIYVGQPLAEVLAQAAHPHPAEGAGMVVGEEALIEMLPTCISS